MSGRLDLNTLGGVSGCARANTLIVDEKYSYKDKAKPGPTPPWPCSPFYDLKAFRWWMRGADLGDLGHPGGHYGKTLFWNIG
jgi:hypothetical protein